MQQRGRTRSGGADKEVIHNGVLVDPGATAVGGDAVGHHVTNLVREVTRDLHDARIAARQSRHTELAGQTECGPGLGEAFGPVEVVERRTDGGTEITELEVPLTSHRAGRNGGRDTGGRRATERETLSIAQLTGANLNGINEHLTALVLVTVTEEDG